MALVATDLGPLAEARSFQRYVAGAEANVAVAVSRLGHVAALVGRVGADGFGDTIVRRLRGEGVDVSGLAVDETAPTGILVRERRGVGPAEVVYHRSGSAGSHLSPDDVAGAGAMFARARWLHITGVTPALSESCHDAVFAAVSLARSVGLTVSLDLNVRRKRWAADRAATVLRELVVRVDVVLADLDEARLVGGLVESTAPADAASRLLAFGPSTAVIKLGSEGALELRPGRPPVGRPALPVARVVDPVGAGDAFAGGYIAGRLEGMRPRAALDLANACGAAAVAAIGDLTGLPSRAEVDRLLASATQDALR